MSRYSRFRGLGLGLLLSALPLVQAASPAAVEFSADTLQTDPKNNQRSGRIYVGKQRIRSEMQQNGQPVVSIIDTEQRTTWVLYPQQRSYIEYSSADAVAGEQNGSPCEGIPGAECRRLGEEQIQGRPAVKWSVKVPGQGGAVQSTQWIGKQRSILLRQEVPGGPVMEQKMLGVEQLQGREVEKWEMVVTQGSQQQRSTRWFDPQLNLAIREQNPGGYLRELRNIRVGEQSPELFTIPADYRKIVPQPPKRSR
ncbi:MAG: hypothetical protein OQL28_11750 [Sedimenticola sp.]|nr:hypothetical protein [Sedimenticola sp.]